MVPDCAGALVQQPARYAVIGDPVEHSLSPRLFALMFERLGIGASYQAERVTAETLPAFLQRARQGELGGFSVTLPHKERILPLLDDVGPLVRRAGAANCVLADGARLCAFNTDLDGIRLALGDCR